VADDEERYVAREIELDHPEWMVLWGCYSRLFWAFARFQVPSGTIVSAPTRDKLIADMWSVEAEFMGSPHARGYGSPTPAAPLPRRVPLAQRHGQQQHGIPAAAFSPAGALLPDDEIEPWRPARVPAQAPPWPPATNYDPYASGPIGPGGGDLDWARAHDDVNPFAPDRTTHY
jgi:hypothetical protein